MVFYGHFRGLNMSTVFLGSASPRRQELFKALYQNFQILTADSEPEARFGDPAEFVTFSAAFKARTIHRLPEAEGGLLFTFDTVVALGQRLLGKPSSKDVARDMLEELFGQSHSVFTGFAVMDPSGNLLLNSAEETRVSFDLGQETDLNRWLEGESWQDKAGGYAIQDSLCAPFIRSIDGCWYNVVGLPVARLCRELSNLGLRG